MHVAAVRANAENFMLILVPRLVGNIQDVTRVGAEIISLRVSKL